MKFSPLKTLKPYCMSVDITKGYDYPRLSVVRNPEELPVLFIQMNELPVIQMNESPGKKKRKRSRKEKPADPFKDWCMPEQPGRYIRGKDHEFF